jgi:hypothetical protein
MRDYAGLSFEFKVLNGSSPTFLWKPFYGQKHGKNVHFDVFIYLLTFLKPLHFDWILYLCPIQHKMARKRNKRHLIRKEEVVLSSFWKNMIFYVDSLMESMHTHTHVHTHTHTKLLELVSNFRKVENTKPIGKNCISM